MVANAGFKVYSEDVMVKIARQFDEMAHREKNGARKKQFLKLSENALKIANGERFMVDHHEI